MKGYAVTLIAIGLASSALAQSPNAMAIVAPSPAVIFRQARTEAAQLPALLAARELGLIASDEIVATPSQGLKDYRALYDQVHAWQTGGDSLMEQARASVRWFEEQDAIDAFAEQGKFKQALAWLAEYHPGESAGQTVGMVCSRLINQMLAHQQFQQATAAIRQCTQGGDTFPFDGAATALAAQPSPEMDRMSIALDGTEAASSAVYVPAASRFLAAVHAAFPRMDEQVENAILALLSHARKDARSHPEHATPDRRGAAMLLALLDGFDPQAAQAAKIQFPAAASASFGGGLIYETSPRGKVTGASIGRPIENRLDDMAASDPERAMNGAAKIKNKDERFAALAGIAYQAAHSRPVLAGNAADQAYELLDSDVAAAETGFAANLANAYAVLGVMGRASDAAGIVLDAADLHAVQAEDQFDLSTPDGIANLSNNLILPAVAISYPYANLASHFPRLVLQHAHNCECAVLRPLVLAKLAEGMTAAGARALH